MHPTAKANNSGRKALHGLVFAKYGDLAASTRQRFVQAMPYLAAENITLTIRPLLDNHYLATLFQHGTRKPTHIAAAYARRFLQLFQCRDYDFILVQYELFPYLPAWFESLLRLTGKPVFYDMDDAMFHQYDAHPKPWVRRLLGKKLVLLLRQSRIAFCGNAYLADYARPYAQRTEIIPTTVDVDRFKPLTPAPQHAPPVLGWIGSPSTWNYCKPLLDTIGRLTDAGTLTMLVVGAGHNAAARTGFEFRDWAESNEVNDIQQMDIGIMPSPEDGWARGKCGYKLIQYMACGLPVIASPVGVNRTLVTHGVNGFHATTDEQWRWAIEQLMADPALRQRMGAAGRAMVVRDYAIQRYGPRLAQLIHEGCGT